MQYNHVDEPQRHEINQTQKNKYFVIHCRTMGDFVPPPTGLSGVFFPYVDR